jgi:hypothetical protein
MLQGQKCLYVASYFPVPAFPPYTALSSSCTGPKMFCLFVSTIQPFMSISSKMKCACQKQPRLISMCPCNCPAVKGLKNRLIPYHLQVEHQVQFTDVAKVSIQGLHQSVYELQYSQLVLEGTFSGIHFSTGGKTLRQYGCLNHTENTIRRAEGGVVGAYLLAIYSHKKEKGGIPPINDLEVSMLHKGALKYKRHVIRPSGKKGALF